MVWAAEFDPSTILAQDIWIMQFMPLDHSNLLNYQGHGLRYYKDLKGVLFVKC